VSDELILILIWLTMLVLTAVIIYKTFRRPQFGPLTHLFLRVSSETRELTLYWDKLRFAPGSYKIKQSKPLGRITVGKIKIQFTTRIRFVERETLHETKIADSRYITPWQARLLKQILQHGTYTVTLIVTNTQRTVTQLIHEKTVNRATRWDNVSPSGGRIIAHYTPQPQSEALIELEQDETSTRTTETETQTEQEQQPQTVTQRPPSVTPIQLLNMGRVGVGRGAAIRQILESRGPARSGTILS
jgi:hypothetical protein